MKNVSLFLKPFLSFILAGLILGYLIFDVIFNNPQVFKDIFELAIVMGLASGIYSLIKKNGTTNQA